MPDKRKIAYFSMEIGLNPDMPTYAGGLGVLAGDTIRSAADLRVPMVAVTLLHRQGYFTQQLDESGWQTEKPAIWNVNDFLQDSGVQSAVEIDGRRVVVRAWRYDVKKSDFVVPVFLLDTDVESNKPWDRELTSFLYGGDEYYRLCQEVILGVAGIKTLRALGYDRLERFHLNEGHAALLTLELLREQREANAKPQNDAENHEAVRSRCVFTTHTPVWAGHDQFPVDMAAKVLRSVESFDLKPPICHHGRLNLTFLALSMSGYVNGVAKSHGVTSQNMFAEYKIDSITNGVHAVTWTSDAFAELYDEHIPGWREDNFSLRYALGIAKEKIWNAHLSIKKSFIDNVNERAAELSVNDRPNRQRQPFQMDVLTIGFARRATGYKRADLVLTDMDRLRHIARKVGKLQIVFAGKAHPRDEDGKRLIQRVVRAAGELAGSVNVAYLPNYDMQLAGLITAGVDLWLNTPEPPLEASGTSGMKAALNGVPSLSVLDGWWIEGCIEGTTGWAIGDHPNLGVRRDDACSLYDKLEHVIVPMFYQERERYIEVMRNAIALNGSFFNTQRMVQQYAQKAYL